MDWIEHVSKVGIEVPALFLVVVFSMVVLRLLVRMMHSSQEHNQRMADSCHESHREIASTLTGAMAETREEHRTTMTGFTTAIHELKDEIRESRLHRTRRQHESDDTGPVRERTAR